APGGGGKVPLLPEYVESFSEDEVVLRNFKGERYVYQQPGHRVAGSDPEYLLDLSTEAITPQPSAISR
ncbi:MAG TPA: hypothetical protein VLB00_06725, partial [Gemmatimonadales bacterium]|nr:hypothetical protein [Gemmatimonadales bacterium]